MSRGSPGMIMDEDGVRDDRPADTAPDAFPEDLVRCAVGLWAERGRRTELPARGLSMWPAIRSGDRITVRHGGANPEVGQVVLVVLDGRRVAHRVIDRRMTDGAFQVRTKGDFTLAVDPGWTGPDRTIGVVEEVVRRGVVLRRPALHGRAARLMAGASRWQGRLCAPLQWLWFLLIARRLGRAGRAGRAG
jgi:hypothetical protein